MKKNILLSLLFWSSFTYAQQYVKNIPTPTDTIYENIRVEKLFSDSLVSSFQIEIKKSVAPHQHLAHSEHVYIIEGTGDMLIGNETFKIKKGDLLFIPKGTIHALKVTSDNPMKVLSIQAPEFDGKDRVIIENVR